MTTIRISDIPFKCKQCGRIGQIYPMHFCSSSKGMVDIEGHLYSKTVPLTLQEKKEWEFKHNPTIFQKIIKWFKQNN